MALDFRLLISSFPLSYRCSLAGKGDQASGRAERFCRWLKPEGWRRRVRCDEYEA